MKQLLILANKLENINRVIAIITRWSVLLMLSLGFWNVLGRYISVIIGHNLSSNALIEGQWYLFDVIFLLGMGWTLQQKGHVRVDIFQSRLAPKRKAQIELFGTLILLLPFALGVMAISIEPTWQSWKIWEVSPDPNGLPRYWVKSLIPLGFLLLTLQGIAEAIKTWNKIQKISKENNLLVRNISENHSD